jgi:hypothetical protein|nr:MAG TPA: protein of unknown function (DUF4969) [Caudoviricetes sp.]
MKAKREEIMRWCVLAGVLLVLMLILIGCGARQKAPPSQSEVRRDSVSTKVVERTIYKHDTVRLHVPYQVATAKVKDSTSRLENDWAVSTAHVYADGTLQHSLETKAGPRQMETETPIIYRDSIVYRDRDVRKVEPRMVEKPLTPWQKKQIAGFWVLVSVVATFALWKARRIWIPLIRRLI